MVISLCPGNGEAESDHGKGRTLAFIRPERYILKALSWRRTQPISGSTVVAWAGHGERG